MNVTYRQGCVAVLFRLTEAGEPFKCPCCSYKHSSTLSVRAHVRVACGRDPNHMQVMDMLSMEQKRNLSNELTPMLEGFDTPTSPIIPPSSSLSAFGTLSAGTGTSDVEMDPDIPSSSCEDWRTLISHSAMDQCNLNLASVVDISGFSDLFVDHNTFSTLSVMNDGSSASIANVGRLLSSV